MKLTKYQIEQKTKSLIKKFVKKGKRKNSKGFDWEGLGFALDKLEREIKDAYNYPTYSDKIKYDFFVQDVMEDVYDYYFKVGNMYNHIHGNEHLKELI